MVFTRSPTKTHPGAGMNNEDSNKSLIDMDDFPRKDDASENETNVHGRTSNNDNNNNNHGRLQGNNGLPALQGYLGDNIHANLNIPPGHVYAVNLNLPQFTTAEPEMWFVVAEADFLANRITSDKRKYSQILKSLPTKVTKQLWYIIGHPPAQNKYDSLKAAILKCFSDTRQVKLRKLLKDL